MATSTLPLNKFRLIAKKLNSGDNTIYQEDLEVASIVLSCQITNMTGTTQVVSVLIEKNDDIGNLVTLLKNASIPPNESLNPFGGKIVLERNDKLIFNTNNTGTLETVLSILENAIN
jgi:hypothetical protein